MKKVILLLILLLLPLVSAADTIIKVKTFPFHAVQLAIIKDNGESSEVIETLRGEADKYGDLQFTMSNGLSNFHMNAFVYWNGEKVYKENFDDPFETGGEISITLAPEGATLMETPGAVVETPAETETLEDPIVEPAEEPVADEPTTDLVVQENPEELPEETQTQEIQDSVAITGNALAESQDSTMPLSYLYYLLGALLLAGILFFVFKSRGSYPHNQFKPASKSDAHYVMQLERKLKNAEHQITAMKNQEKIKDVEKRIEEEKKEIERLRHGY